MTGARFPLETACRLSRSVLWRLQRRFYERQGMAAWSEGVIPHHVTSNPYIARAYARVILGFVRDWRDRLDPAQPLYIVEVGAGSGRMTFHLLRELPAMLDGQMSAPVRYVMTDVAEANLAAWRAHPQLAHWLGGGLLDLARFDAAHDRTIALERSGEVLAPGRVANPVIAIVNYVFDSLPFDAFTVAEGRLHEWWVRLCSLHPDGDLDDPTLLDRVRLTCELRPVEPVGYYGDAALDRVLDEHCAALPDTAFAFPLASLDCLARLAELAGGRLLVLSTDKGCADAAGLRGQTGLQLTLHGSFSTAVNYHALARWVSARGGEALLPAVRPRTITTCGFVLGSPPGAAETRRAYADAIEAQRPDDLFAIEQGLEPAHAALGLDQWIGYLRFTGCAPRLVTDALPHLMALVRAGEPPPGLRAELLHVLARAWDSYFHIGEPFDLGLALGELAVAIAAWPEAIGFFEGSLRWCGPTPGAAAGLAECHDRLGDAAAARRWLDEALALDPAHAGARALAARLAGRDAPALV